MRRDDVADLKGQMLEIEYRNKAAAYFGPMLRKLTVIECNALWEQLEAHLSDEELDNVLALDLIVRGKSRKHVEKGNFFLAVEISYIVDPHDIERARQRADLLKKSGFQAIPVAAGKNITDDAWDAARKHQVVILQNGRRFFWEEILHQMMTE